MITTFLFDQHRCQVVRRLRLSACLWPADSWYLIEEGSCLSHPRHNRLRDDCEVLLLLFLHWIAWLGEDVQPFRHLSSPILSLQFKIVALLFQKSLHWSFGRMLPWKWSDYVNVCVWPSEWKMFFFIFPDCWDWIWRICRLLSHFTHYWPVYRLIWAVGRIVLIGIYVRLSTTANVLYGHDQSLLLVWWIAWRVKLIAYFSVNTEIVFNPLIFHVSAQHRETNHRHWQ